MCMYIFIDISEGRPHPTAVLHTHSSLIDLLKEK